MKKSVIDRIVESYARKKAVRKNIITAPSIDELKDNCFNRVFLPGCCCSDGTAANLFLWKGNGEDLMISFCGGGVVTSREDCRYPISMKSFLGNKTMTYAANSGPFFDFAFFMLNKNQGIISPTEENPFAGWDKAIIPYVCGDFHTGTADFTYTDQKGENQIFHSNGYTNFLKSMELIKKRWPSPKRILITGSSAGSFGTSALAGKISEYYPECQNIIVYCDSSYLKCDRWKEITEELWKCPQWISDSVGSDDLGGDWLEALYENYGDRLKILYSSSTKDGVLARFTHYIHDGTYQIEVDPMWFDTVREGLRDRINRFSEKGIRISYYINDRPDKLSGGTAHCISQDINWSQYEVDGVTNAKWVYDAVNGKLYDVGMELL